MKDNRQGAARSAESNRLGVKSRSKKPVLKLPEEGNHVDVDFQTYELEQLNFSTEGFSVTVI